MLHVIMDRHRLKSKLKEMLHIHHIQHDLLKLLLLTKHPDYHQLNYLLQALINKKILYFQFSLLPFFDYQIIFISIIIIKIYFSLLKKLKP